MGGPKLPFMDKVGIELALLAKFILACQSPRISDTAAILGQTPSALGVALHGLEQRLGMQLFVRQGGSLRLRPSAFWLFRSACRLLYLEQHVREAAAVRLPQLQRLTIELDLSFAIGRFSKALIRTTQQAIRHHPELLVDWRFNSEDDDGDEHQNAVVLDIPPDRSATVRIVHGQPADRVKGSVQLFEDPWVAVGAAGTSMDRILANNSLAAMRMRPALIEAITRYAQDNGIGDLKYLDAEPALLDLVLTESPHLVIVMPSSMLASRMGLVGHERTNLVPQLVSSFSGFVSGSVTDKAGSFLTMLQDNLRDGEDNIAFVPRLTTRQVRHFNLVAHTGGISAAARVANAAQSSVSANLLRMEAVLEAPLLERREDGTILSSFGAKILPVTTDIEARLDRIIRKSHDIAAHAEARVTIGTLPSSGYDSVMTEKLARVVTAIHARHPAWQLQVLESSNSVLHERIRAGELNIAVVGVVRPQVARIRLGPSEPLCIVAHPSFGFNGRTEFDLDEACRLPLVLGKRHLSIHQVFTDAARKHKLHPRPAIEVGSLALAIAMVKQARLCTILPASSVRQDIAAGTLTAIPITHPELAGALSVIFSADRSLSEAERTIIENLVREFRVIRENQLPAEAGVADPNNSFCRSS